MDDALLPMEDDHALGWTTAEEQVGSEPPVSATPASDQVDPRTRAAYLLDAGLPQDALDVLSDHLADRPNDTRARVFVAMGHLALGDARRAFHEALEVLDLDPDLDAAWRIAASSASVFGRTDAARQCARIAVALGPDDWANHLIVAGAGLATGEVDRETFTAACEAVRLAPDEPNAHVTLASVWAGKRRARKALASARRALLLDPQNAAAKQIESLMTKPLMTTALTTKVLTTKAPIPRATGEDQTTGLRAPA